MNFPFACYELAKVAGGDGDTEEESPVESYDDNSRKPRRVKTAAKAVKDQPSDLDLAAAGGTGAAIAGGGLVARGGLERAFQSHMEEPVSSADALLHQKLRAGSPVPLHQPTEVTGHYPGWLRGMMGPSAPQQEKEFTKRLQSELSDNAAFIPQNETIRVPSGKDAIVLGHGGFASKPGILAHELGHADIHRSGVGRLIQNRLGGIALRVGAHPAFGVASGALTGATDNETAQALGRWAPALAAAPGLLSEGGATALGLMRMRRAGASGGDVWRAAKGLIPAFGSYAAPVAISTGAAHMGQAAAKTVKKELRAAEGSSLEKASAKDVKYLLDQISKEPKVRPAQAEAPSPKYRVKQGSLMSSMLDEMLKLNGMATTPKGRLHSSQIVGQPKESDPDGPSTSSLSKPYGYGHTQPGTAKNTI